MPNLSCRSGTLDGENSVHSPFSITRRMNRSGIQLAVFMSCVRRRSSPVFLRSSRNSSMSRCQRFQVGADGALALAALVDGHRRVVDDLEERHHALRFAVGALDVGAQRAHPRPVVAQAAGELGQQRVFLDRLVDAVQVVRHRGQVAGRQLRAQRAAVEQRRRAGHEVEARQHLVELDRARFAVDLVQARPMATRMKKACGSSMRVLRTCRK